MSDSTAGPRGARPDAKTMRRTYLFALKDAGGAVSPEIGVARRLAARGHNVVVLGDYSMAKQVAGAGATYRSWTDGETGEVRDWALHTPTALARDMFQNMIGG